uniref:Uncharacterized protein n=1 Tax=Romanomermis culicivorax TaxID=13658 RepID=A0A915KSI5_ROMCU
MKNGDLRTKNKDNCQSLLENNVSTVCNNNQPNSPLKKLATLSIRSGSTNFLAVLAKKSTTPDARSPNVASLFDGEIALTAAFLASTKTSWAFCNVLKTCRTRFQATTKESRGSSTTPRFRPQTLQYSCLISDNVV